MKKEQSANFEHVLQANLSFHGAIRHVCLLAKKLAFACKSFSEIVYLLFLNNFVGSNFLHLSILSTLNKHYDKRKNEN